MKCFSYIILFLLLTQTAIAENYKLICSDTKTFTTGDMVRLKLENLDYQSALKYKNSRITNLFYVLNVFQKDYQTYLEVILSEDKNFIAKDDSFEVEGLSYKSVKLDLNKGIEIIDNKIVLIKDKVVLVLSILGALVILFFIFRFFNKKYKLKKSIEVKRKSLKLEQDICDREHLELFYLKRKLFKELYSYDLDSYKDFKDSLNLIQYKKYWSNEEFELVSGKYNKLILTIKDKNGV